MSDLPPNFSGVPVNMAANSVQMMAEVKPGFDAARRMRKALVAGKNHLLLDEAAFPFLESGDLVMVVVSVIRVSVPVPEAPKLIGIDKP